MGGVYDFIAPPGFAEILLTFWNLHEIVIVCGIGISNACFLCIQRDLVRVHAIEGIHTVEVGRHQLVFFIVAKHRLRSQCVNSEFTMETLYWLSIRCHHDLPYRFKIVHMNALVGMIPDCQVNGSPAGRTEFC